MENDERIPIQLPMQRKVNYTTSGDQNLHSALCKNSTTLKIPRDYQRQSSQWTHSLSQLLKKKNRFQRLIDKDGSCNIVHKNLKYRRFRFISDAYTTIIDLKWRYILLILTMTYLFSWFFFALAWYTVAWIHGDTRGPYWGFGGDGEFSSIPSYENKYGEEPCVYFLHNFFSSFLFSVETQTTIGYGLRGTSTACVYAAALQAVQNIFSYIINTVMLGLIFAKIGSPSNRVLTLKFSRNAVIAMRNGKLCFMFRVGNIRSSHIYETHIRAYAIKPAITEEGEYVPLYHHNMDFNFSMGEDRTLLIWPVIICHVIDEKSPLYELSANDLADADLEVVVFLEGVVEQTGLVTQARTSYTPSEIKWGHCFSSGVIGLKGEKDKMYKILNYKKFNSIYEVPNMPLHSAKDLYREMRKKKKDDAREKEINIQKVKIPDKVHVNVISSPKGQTHSLHHCPQSPTKGLQSIVEDPLDSDQLDVDHNPSFFAEEPHTITTPNMQSMGTQTTETQDACMSCHNQILQDLSHQMKTVQSALVKLTTIKDTEPPVLTRHYSTPGLRSSPRKRKSWDPKRISLELKRRSQGSPARFAPTKTSSLAEESCLVPMDDTDDEEEDKSQQGDSCSVS